MGEAEGERRSRGPSLTLKHHLSSLPQPPVPPERKGNSAKEPKRGKEARKGNSFTRSAKETRINLDSRAREKRGHS